MFLTKADEKSAFNKAEEALKKGGGIQRKMGTCIKEIISLLV